MKNPASTQAVLDQILAALQAKRPRPVVPCVFCGAQGPWRNAICDVCRVEICAQDE